MGHHIEAIITCDEINVLNAEKLRLPIFDAPQVKIIGLCSSITDYWADKMRLKLKWFSKMGADNNITHYFANNIGAAKYAIIQTDIFGGVGSQQAVAYNRKKCIFPYKEGKTPCEGSIFKKRDTWLINKCLQKIGVNNEFGKDEFDTINLGTYRDFDHYFEWLD